MIELKGIKMIKWEKIINLAWKNISSEIENEIPCSSEKTLVFLLACEIKKSFNDDNLVIDFESKPYEDLKDNISKEKNKFLDLLIYTDKNYKIAIEVKFPTSNGNNSSDQTNTRVKIYKDLYRLDYLINKKSNNIKEAYFLMVLNEDAYLNPPRAKNGYASNYHTYNKFSLKKYIPSDNEYKLSLDNTFNYIGIEKSKTKNKIINKFAYLVPMKIKPSQSP